jgi:hypothetical protein
MAAADGTKRPAEVVKLPAADALDPQVRGASPVVERMELAPCAAEDPLVGTECFEMPWRPTD